MKPEDVVKKAVHEYLTAAGIMFFRMQSGKVAVKRGRMQLCPVGTADFLVFPPNRTLWVELKALGQKTAKLRAVAQAEFRDKVLAAGHEHLTAYSVEDVSARVRNQKAGE